MIVMKGFIIAVLLSFGSEIMPAFTRPPRPGGLAGLNAMPLSNNPPAVLPNSEFLPLENKSSTPMMPPAVPASVALPVLVNTEKPLVETSRANPLGDLQKNDLKAVSEPQNKVGNNSLLEKSLDKNNNIVGGNAPVLGGAVENASAKGSVANSKLENVSEQKPLVEGNILPEIAKPPVLKVDLSRDSEDVPLFDEATLKQVKDRSVKMNDLVKRARETADDMDKEYEKSQNMLQKFAKETGSKISGFEYFFNQMKKYSSDLAIENSSNKKFKDLQTSMTYAVQEMSQDLASVETLKKDIDSAYKEILNQLKVKDDNFQQVLDNDNACEVLTSELYSSTNLAEAAKTERFKKIDELLIKTEAVLKDIQNVSTGFKSKVELGAGKLKDVGDVLEGLQKKKTSLEGLVKDIHSVKQQGAAEKEEVLLNNLKKNDVREKKESLASQVINEAKQSIVQQELVGKNEEAIAVKSFFVQVLIGIQDFFVQAFTFLKKSIDALMLKASVTENKKPSVVGATDSAVNPVQNNISVTTTPNVGLGLSLTPSYNLNEKHLSEDKSQVNQNADVSFSKKVLEALAEVFSGIKKLFSVFAEYLMAVYKNFSK